MCVCGTHLHCYVLHIDRRLIQHLIQVPESARRQKGREKTGDVSGHVLCSASLTFQFLKYVHRVPHL